MFAATQARARRRGPRRARSRRRHATPERTPACTRPPPRRPSGGRSGRAAAPVSSAPRPPDAAPSWRALDPAARAAGTVRDPERPTDGDEEGDQGGVQESRVKFHPDGRAPDGGAVQRGQAGVLRPCRTRTRGGGDDALRGGGFGGFGRWKHGKQREVERDESTGGRPEAPGGDRFARSRDAAEEGRRSTASPISGRTWRRSLRRSRRSAPTPGARGCGRSSRRSARSWWTSSRRARRRGDDDVDGPVRSREANDVLLLLGKCAEEGRDGERVVRLVVVQDRELERFFGHGALGGGGGQARVGGEMLEKLKRRHGHEVRRARAGRRRCRDPGVARGGTRACVVSFVETEKRRRENQPSARSSSLRGARLAGGARDELETASGTFRDVHYETRKARTFVVALSTVARATRHTRRWRRSRTS